MKHKEQRKQRLLEIKEKQSFYRWLNKYVVIKEMREGFKKARTNE